MPFAQMTQKINPKIGEMEKKLVEEWENPQASAPEPIIIEENERQQAPSHLYVIWSEWGELSQYERSRIIMNAYEKVRGRSLALNVAVAMGLTPEEAQRMGIEYAPIDDHQPQ